MSSWRRVVRVGMVVEGMVGVLDFIDIFEMRGGWFWRSKLAARGHGAGIATGKHQPARVNVKVPQRP
jgi:hypothetical protein